MRDRPSLTPDPSTQLPLPRRELRGVVERITFQNPENGYTVARLAPERAETAPTTGDERLVTMVGTLPDLQPGEAIVATGFWVNDPKHGWQFRALEARTTLPATLQGMKRYLGSGLVEGIGPVMGSRIVEAFAEETFAVIDEDPQRLAEVPGIGPVRAGRIAATWVEQRHIREVMAALQGYGISTSLAVRIYKRFGDDSARVIAHEPYRLAREVWGIGFKTADKIAQAIGIALDAPEPLQAGVKHALGQAADAGHTLLPEGELIAQAAALLGAEVEPITVAIIVLTGTGELIPATTHEPEGTERRMLVLAPFARAESGLASRLHRLHGAAGCTGLGQVFAATDWDVAFHWLETRQGIQLSPEQEDGVRMALTSPVSILTGGPGTGKTHKQGAGSGIAANAKRINAGQLPRFGGGVGDCFFLPAQDPAEAAQLVVDLVAQRLPARYGFQVGEVQVLSPMHRGEAGVGALNTRVQERLNPPKGGLSEARGGGRVYRPGDRVLQLKNDYTLEVFNGDLGTVRAVEPIEQEMLVALDDGREIRYPFGGLHQLTFAYAISVHKAQGAEFPAVVIPLLTSHAAMLGRTLLYTAVTRAQRLVVIVGQQRALAMAVKDWRRSPRHNALGTLLSGSLRYSWPRHSLLMPEEDNSLSMPEAWEGLLGGASA